MKKRLLSLLLIANLLIVGVIPANAAVNNQTSTLNDAMINASENIEVDDNSIQYSQKIGVMNTGAELSVDFKLSKYDSSNGTDDFSIRIGDTVISLKGSLNNSGSGNVVTPDSLYRNVPPECLEMAKPIIDNALNIAKSGYHEYFSNSVGVILGKLLNTEKGAAILGELSEAQKDYLSSKLVDGLTDAAMNYWINDVMVGMADYTESVGKEIDNTSMYTLAISGASRSMSKVSDLYNLLDQWNYEALMNASEKNEQIRKNRIQRQIQYALLQAQLSENERKRQEGYITNAINFLNKVAKTYSTSNVIDGYSLKSAESMIKLIDGNVYGVEKEQLSQIVAADKKVIQQVTYEKAILHLSKADEEYINKGTVNFPELYLSEVYAKQLDASTHGVQKQDIFERIKHYREMKS